MRIIIFGSNGMLGTYLTKYLTEKGYDVVGLTRREFDVMTDDIETVLLKYINSGTTVVINAIGTIPQAAKNHTLNDRMYIKINSVFPNVLAVLCDRYNVPLIHSTTDCVFDGLKGGYVETDEHNASNIYGITKSLGESKCTVIRTSIIGEELVNKRSLLEWVKSNKNGEINGYLNHYWNGITCLQYAKIVDDIIRNGIFWSGVRHIHSPTSVSKYELVNMINDIYGLNIKINEHVDKVECDRTMESNYEPLFVIPEIVDQIREIKEYNL